MKGLSQTDAFDFLATVGDAERVRLYTNAIANPDSGMITADYKVWLTYQGFAGTGALTLLQLLGTSGISDVPIIDQVSQAYAGGQKAMCFFVGTMSYKLTAVNENQTVLGNYINQHGSSIYTLGATVYTNAGPSGNKSTPSVTSNVPILFSQLLTDAAINYDLNLFGTIYLMYPGA